MTGLARSTVSQRLNVLLGQRWIVPAEEAISSGGRPATAFAFNRAGRVVIAADLGATHARVAIADLAANILSEVSADLLIDEGPEPVLSWLVETAQRLLAESGHSTGDVCGVGVGLPGPVEHVSGRPISPPIMPGWENTPPGARSIRR
jgi:predicted NBD/HSP70 family sugar kinase